MNLDALVTKGRLPWSPSPDARDLDVWYEYEYPYVGTFVAGVRSRRGPPHQQLGGV
jgi:hypothetical protein